MGDGRGTDVLILNLGAKLGRVVKAALRPSGKKANKHCRRGSLSSTGGMEKRMFLSRTAI